MLLIISAVIFLEVIFIILIGYVGIIIGHRSNKNKMGKTITISVALYLGTSTLTLVIIYIFGLFNKNIMNLINTTDIVNVTTIKTVMLIGTCIYILYNVIYYLIGKKLFEKGVNVD